MRKGIKRSIALLCAGVCLYGASGCAVGGNTSSSSGGGNQPMSSEEEIEQGEKIEVELYKEPYVVTVATDGSGDYATLADALAGVKVMRADEDIMKTCDSIVIRLEAGRHLITETVVIDEEIASGDIPVVIEGATDGETVLDGGIQVKGGWTAHGNGIYKKQVSGVEAFRQLYIDGNVGTRSRYPNDTGNLAGDYMPLTWNENKAEHANVGCVAIPATAKYDFSKQALQSAELHFVQEWTQSVGHIWNKSWTERDNLLYFGFEESWFTNQLFKREAPIRRKTNNKPNMCWLENSLEFVDAENEWYFDKNSSMLYYKPKAGVDINSLTFEIPQTESLIQIKGTPEKVAQDISLSKLTIANTNWGYVNTTGYIDGQAGLFYTPTTSYFETKSTSAGLYTLYAHDITVDNCVIKNMGAYGVDFYVGTKNARLINSTIKNTAGSAVNIGSYGEKMLPDGYASNAAAPAKQEEITEKITVHNNWIEKVGTGFKGGSTGIVAGFARELILEQNTITDVSYSGIAVGWGWEQYNSVLRNFKINRNHITNTMNHLPYDGGPIYLLGRHIDTLERSEIKGNYIEASGLGGIYFDNSSSSYVVANNVIKGEGLNGSVDLHDWNYLLHDITVTRTFSNLKNPVKGVYRQHYWSDTGREDPNAPSTEGRGVYYEPSIFAYEGGQWSEEAQLIISFAGKIQ